MHHGRRTQRSPRRRTRVRETSLSSAVLVLTVVATPVIARPTFAADAKYAQAQQLPAETSQPANISPAPAMPPAAQAPTPPPPAPASAPKAPPPAETPAMVLNGQQVESILGKKVRSTSGDDMGRIIDIIADKTGQVRAAIVDFGGFLGVGNRQIAVDWKAIRFPTDGKTDAVIVDLSKDQLRVAPVYKPGEQIVVLGQPQPAVAPQAPPSPAPQATTDAVNPPTRDAPSK